MADPKTPEPVNDFDAVREKIQFKGFTKSQQETILDQLEEAYNAKGGTTGRDMIDAGIALPDGFTIHNSNSQDVIEGIVQDPINDFIAANPEVSITPAQQAQINQNKLDQFNGYIKSDGTPVPPSLSGNFAFPGTGDVYINSYPSKETDPATKIETTETYDFTGMTRLGETADEQAPIRSLDHDGVVFEVPPVYTLLHEANHANNSEGDLSADSGNGRYFAPGVAGMPGIAGNPNLSVAQSYYGENEATTQKMLEEMGFEQFRGSYSGTAGLDDVPIGSDYGLNRNHEVSVTTSQGIDMTGHAPVSATIVGYSAAEIKAAAADQGVTFTDAQSLQFVSNTFKLGNANDTVHAFDGNDIVHMGAGDDRVFLGTGNDTAHAGWGANTIDGGDANLDPASDHRSDTTTDWGIDTVDYTTLKAGFAAPDALQADATFDGVARDGVLITMDGNDISVTKGQENAVRAGEDVDSLHNIDAVTGTARDDLTEVSALSGDRAIDGSGGTDTLRIKTFPEGTTVTNTPGAVTYNGATYDGVISDGTNNLYYTDYENIVLPKVETPTAGTSADATSNHIEATGVDAGIPPIDASLDGAPTQTLPMENALRILHERGAEAVELERASGIEDGPVATMIETPAGAAAFKTLVSNGETSIEVDAADMAGDSYSQVKSVVRGGLERLHEIDKVSEAENLHANHVEQEHTAEISLESEIAPEQYNASLAEAEMEHDHSF